MLGRAAHAAEPGVLDHVGEHAHADEGRHQDEDFGIGQLHEAFADVQPEGAIEQRGHALLARSLAELHVVLQDQRHADGGDQRRQARGVAQRLVGDALDGPAVYAGNDDGEHQRAEDQQREGFQAEERQQRQGDGREVGGDHVHLAMGEVDHADDAVDHRVTDGDQAVDRP
ncbi:hypothetical protein D3C81_1535860 [compost metagenome]